MSDDVNRTKYVRVVRSVPDAEQLRALLAYDPDTGALTWRSSPSGRANENRFIGRPAGTDNGRGYRNIQIGGRFFRAHRVAWCIAYGEWPTESIDHINGNRSDNRLANLRLATRQQNAANAKVQANNQSGLKGVTRNRRRWTASIRANRRTIYLGTYETPEAAHAAYVAAAVEHFGEFARAA